MTADDNTMTTRDIQALKRYTHPSAASAWAQRNGVQPIPTTSNKHLWPRDQIWEVYNNPRQGIRSDLGYTSIGDAPTSRARPRMTRDDWLILGYLMSAPDAVVRTAHPGEEPNPAEGVAHPNRLAGMAKRGLVRKRKPRAKDGRNARSTATITGLGRDRWQEREAWGQD